ncbi:DUF3987 domain-containing protein [Mariniflexile ostreae]|uniref:DUF3987 domain-containing protein n=1 Tax=Mariniflexile ostreae TaxID=1520892 RepID=A0ABV5FBC7_9FLAO
MVRKLIDKSIYNRLPEPLQILTEPFEGREKDIVLLSSLGVLSNCFPNVFGIYDGDTIYPHLYLMIIAPAASGKGVMNHSRLLIEKIHDKILSESRTQYLICEESKKNKKKDKDIEPCPNLEVKILPANISSAEMYSYLGSSKHGLLIMESEADTMSNMLKNDWSNYSDVLRKAFQHEPVSISRKIEKVFEDIKEPKLSIVLSGTPDQVQPLVKSKENGLYSRFIVYNFDEISEFKNVFDVKARDNKTIFKEMGNKVFNFYNELENLGSPVEFCFTENQTNKFFSNLRPISTDIIENHTESFIPNLRRHGLILFRIAMILTVLRNRSNIKKDEKLICSNTDFLIALNLMKRLLRHSQFTFNTMESGGLSLQDENILDDLNSPFTRQDAIKIGVKYDIPKRTIDDKLVQWKTKKYILKHSRGKYKKC